MKNCLQHTWVVLVGVTILAHAVFSSQLRASQKNILVIPGQNVTILCHSDVPLRYCRFKLPGYERGFSLSERTKPTKNFAYHGTGLETGECGIAINDIDDRVNGVIYCTASTDDEPQEMADQLKLTVLRSAKPPYLVFDPAPSKRNPHVYKEDYVFRTKCVVEGGRPVAQVEWFLDDKVVTKGLKEPVVVQDKNNLYTISQEFVRRLSWKDHGKQLRCVAKQSDIGSITETAVTWNVIFAPRSKSLVKLYGFTLNTSASVIVEVLVNPQPKFTWVVNGVELGEGSKSADGKLEVSSAENIGVGKWKALLTINQLTEKDISAEYILNAKNIEGEAKYKVVISTEPEPKSLSAGASIAIGVSVIVLVAVSVIVFVLIRRRKRNLHKARIQDM